ncbi:MAG: hypothetical protein LBJ96_04380, partial [Holosporaceae bacterium]|nr:hypothetical protein [Holosporaceae bacterium]
MIKEITYNNKILALIIKADYSKDGVEFFTPNDFSQQLAYMKHPAGKKIKAHTHNITLRNIFYTKEVLVIKKGKLRVDLYDDNKFFVESHVLFAGDVILLA